MTRQAFGRERRRYPRHPAASAYWINPRQGARLSAWLVDWSEGGAACLLPEGALLRVNDRIELWPIPSDDRSVNEVVPIIPRSARVLRVEQGDAPTRKVALRFEAEIAASLDTTPPPRASAHGLSDRPRIRSLPRRLLGCPAIQPNQVDTYPSAAPSSV